jgi:hypothetical protein
MTQFAIPTQAELVRQIDGFLLRHDMKPSRLSREATGEPSLVETIRNGRSPKLATVEKLMNFMAATDAAAALRAKLSAPLDAAPPESEESDLPFAKAPVTDTGASSPTSSPTSGRRSPPAASPPFRESSTSGPSQPTGAGCPSSCAEVTK